MAGNKIRGEMVLQPGDLGEHIFVLDFNALCVLDQEFPGLMDGTVGFESPVEIRRVFTVGLQAHHPGMTEEDAGAVIHELGIQKAAEVLKEAMSISFGTGKTTEAGSAGKSPPKARTSGGAGSGR